MDEALRGIHDFYTPKELALQGGTGHGEITTEEDWDIPLAIKKGVNPKLVAMDREELFRGRNYTFTSFLLLGYLGNITTDAVISLEPLDPQTGRTLRDPRIGILTDEGFVEKPEWMERFRALSDQRGENFHWRPPIEGNPPESKG